MPDVETIFRWLGLLIPIVGFYLMWRKMEREAELTKQLQVDVGKLTKQLDRKIKQIEHMQKLLDDLTQFATTMHLMKANEPEEKQASVRYEIAVRLPRLSGIVNSLENEELSDVYSKFHDAVFSAIGSIGEHSPEKFADFLNVATKMHKIAYGLDVD